MFFYEGYSCPVCQLPFKETDDIVTCPECGAPHHRNCWKENKHCFYQDTHNTPEQWSREKTTTATPQENTAQTTAGTTHTCAHCGTQNSAFAEFCSHCGHSLDAEEWTSSQQQPPFNGEYREYQPFSAPHRDTYINDSEEIDGVKARDLRVFVGQNAQYYLPRFSKLCKRETSVSWNWAAFLLTPYWLWYRKQYLYGTLVLLFEVLQTLCTAFFLYGYLGASAVTGYTDLATLMQQHVGDPVFFRWELVVLLCSVIQMLIRIFFGIVGNYLYFRVAKKRIQKWRAEGSSDFELSRLGGGTMILGAIAYAVLYILTTFTNIWFM